MLKYILICFIAVFLTGCGAKTSKLVGNIYLHSDGNAKQYVGFYQDSLIFKWSDELGTEVFVSPYKLTQPDDSTINIDIANKNKYIENNNWKIILDKDGGFHSADSKKKYVLNSEQIK